MRHLCQRTALPYVPERALFNRRAGSVFANSNQDGEPFQLSTAAIYQQLRSRWPSKRCRSIIARSRRELNFISAGRNGSHDTSAATEPDAGSPVLTGINMRPLLTSIGPLLPDIRAASGMSYTRRTPDRAAGDRDGGAGAGRWLGRSLYRSKAQYCAEPADYRGRRPAAKSPRIVAYCSPALWPEELASALFRPPFRR